MADLDYKVAVLVGPTAVGKTGVALEFARELGAVELLNKAKDLENLVDHVKEI